MNKKCLIIGCGSHAHSVISIVESAGECYEIIGLVDISDDYDPNEEKSGYKVKLSFNELLSNPSSYVHLDLFIAIGENKKRKKIFKVLTQYGFKLPNVSAKTAYVDRTVKLGKGNVISHYVVINAQSEIGDNNLVNTGAIIEHDCLIGCHNHIAPSSVICGNVNISDLVLLGVGSIVLPFLSVRTGTSLGASALLNTNVSVDGKTYIGIPAKVKK
ncbi:NeuD/PglB/VioB family sugar acetyltransferase [Salinivibrio sp. MA607]|uniref:NeuD/PglB/VioB family sugar acetyltransferase n=1 Tax=Salinivibrio sp. MA607 TaxID=1909457 RepID=UPI000989898C|nr:NeuD/PglB/VioB family sugar acetyltransferase [Salinivibrio sp. MA607]OOF01930.1 hypothetical protein BZG81_15275 [Salinivibrio sp. MA607]